MITFLVFVIIIILILDLIIMALMLIVPFGILYLVYEHYAKKRQRELYRHLHTAHYFPPIDDALESMNEIRYFLNSQTRKNGLSGQDLKDWEYPNKYSSNLRFFVQMCHALGCEIIIRRIADHDIESDPDNPKLQEAINDVKKNGL